MRTIIAALAGLVCLGLTPPAHADTPVTLRTRVEATGPAVTLGDVFDGAGSVADRAIAPAPAAGQVSSLSPRFLVAAAESAGLSWTPPSGLTQVNVTHPAGARAMVGPATGGARYTQASAVGDVVVTRGETILVVYDAPGIRVATRARAMENGAAGQSIRATNMQSERVVDVVVTGPGAARAIR